MLQMGHSGKAKSNECRTRCLCAEVQKTGTRKRLLGRGKVDEVTDEMKLGSN